MVVRWLARYSHYSVVRAIEPPLPPPRPDYINGQRRALFLAFQWAAHSGAVVASCNGNSITDRTKHDDDHKRT